MRSRALQPGGQAGRRAGRRAGRGTRQAQPGWPPANASRPDKAAMGDGPARNSCSSPAGQPTEAQQPHPTRPARPRAAQGGAAHLSSTRFLASSLCSSRAACIQSLTLSGSAATPRARMALAFSAVCGGTRGGEGGEEEAREAERQVRRAARVVRRGSRQREAALGACQEPGRRAAGRRARQAPRAAVPCRPRNGRRPPAGAPPPATRPRCWGTARSLSSSAHAPVGAGARGGGSGVCRMVGTGQRQHLGLNTHGCS